MKKPIKRTRMRNTKEGRRKKLKLARKRKAHKKVYEQDGTQFVKHSRKRKLQKGI